MTLALKYRPTRFQDLVGQHSISQTLSLALDQKKISNAYLFSGLRGSGKTSSARIFARALQCDEGPTSNPCGVCDNCKASLEGRHIDIIEMDAASNRKIDDIRDLIEQTKYKPSFGRYKIFIIDEVHMLTKEAFNALLKTLEEPPTFVKFILATTDPLLLPATILSRTQHFRFRKIPHKDIIEHITGILQKENVPYELEALNIIARSGSGSLRDTLTLLEQAIIFGNNKIKLISVTDMLGIIDPQILERFFNAILQKDENLANEILNLMQEYECEMVIDEMLLFLKQQAISKKIAPVVLNRFFNILAQSKTLLSLSTDGEFVLILTLLKLQEATKIKDIHTLISQLESTTLQDQIKTHQKHTQESKQNTPQNPQKHFEILIQRLYDRNHLLGECFEKNITFLAFNNHQLTLQSQAQRQEDKALLREQYVLIKKFILEIFGEQTQILFQQPPQELQNESLNQNSQKQETPQISQQESLKESQEPITQESQESHQAEETLPLQENRQEIEESLKTPIQEVPSQPAQDLSKDKDEKTDFSSKHQVLLTQLKKHLQIDLNGVKKIAK